MRTRSELLEQLAETKRQIERSENVIEAQQHVVDSLLARGFEVHHGEELLVSFKHVREIWLDEMNQLLNMLDEIKKHEDVA
jgi:hypothetical protein